ncbi:MAG TPA: hypothetical protein VH042_04425 [Solirubrobacterales bacterium]|jgi:hypothetical protein|nr:hypothetical protein [Solirubrobacterales bacterium]
MSPARSPASVLPRPLIAALATLALLTTAGPGAAAASGAEAPFRFFAPGSPWNQQLPRTAPLNSSSGEFVAALSREVNRELETDQGPSISTSSNSVPIYTVPAGQPTVPVQLTSTFTVPALSSAWSAVPLPPTAQPAPGKDHHLVVWQPSTNRLWEFWHLVDSAAGWQAGWGGAMQNASSNFGTYGPAAWPGATGSWGGSASSLSIAGGLITLEDLRKGEINHALAIGVPQVRAGEYAAPAERTDGESTNPMALPEGAHLRLDPSLELWRLHLPPLTLMIARAAKRYGIFVRDIAGNVTFYGQDPGTTGGDPYAGPNGFFEGTYPARLLSAFPWTHLQLLQMQLTSSGG